MVDARSAAGVKLPLVSGGRELGNLTIATPDCVGRATIELLRVPLRFRRIGV
jgi:hypothetical protein